MNTAVAAHLSAHSGVVTRQECAALGISKRQLERMVERGELIRMFRGVYRHAAAPVTADQRLYAGLCAAGAGAAISHRSALVLHEARNFSCDLTELSVPSRSLPLHEGLVVHRTRAFAAEDVWRRRGLLVTSPVRTLIDSAVVMSPSIVAKIAQEWMAHKVVRPQELDHAFGRARRLSAVTQLRQILADVDVGETDSVAEGDLGRILGRAGMPPVLHHLATTSTGVTYELDWSYPAERIGLELDGYGVHLRSPDVFESDRHRRNELTLSGWLILNFTSRMCRRQPRVVVDQVRRGAFTVEKCTLRGPNSTVIRD